MPAKQEKDNSVIPLLLAPVMYSVLIPLGITFWLINECARLIVKFLLYYKYGQSVVLTDDGNDAVFNYKAKGNTRNILAVGISKKKSNCDPDKYASIFEKQVLLQDEVVNERRWFGLFASSQRYRRYEKLEKIMTTRFGFTCWELDQNFNVSRHFSLIENPEKLYKEKDVLDLLSILSGDMDETKPQWEYILIPRYQDANGEEKSLQILRIHHAYLDGMSLMLLFKNHLTGGKNELPLDPLTFKIELWQKVIWYTNALLYGPYAFFWMTLNKYKTNWVLNSPYPGEKKIFAWTNEMSMETFKQIRTKTSATVPNVIAFAFAKAVRTVLPSSRIVDNLRFAEIMAMLPYPNPNPVNRFASFSYNISTRPTPESKEEFRKEVVALKRNRLAELIGPQPLLTFYVFKYFGRFPVGLLRHIFNGSQDSIFLSNIPSFTDQLTYFDTDCQYLCAFPPQPNLTGITAASMTYNRKLKLTGVADSSWLTEEELERIFIEIPKVVQAIADLGYIPSVLPAANLQKLDILKSEKVVLEGDMEEGEQNVSSEDEDILESSPGLTKTPLNARDKLKKQTKIHGDGQEDDNNNNNNNNYDTNEVKKRSHNPNLLDLTEVKESQV